MTASIAVQDPLAAQSSGSLPAGITSASASRRSSHSSSNPLTKHQKSKSASANQNLTAAVNGAAPTTAPPDLPNQGIPNGKPASPLVERSNVMPNGGQPQTITSKDPKAAAAAASDMKNIVRRKLTGYVGFANLPNQWHRKSVRKGFNFNVMVVGMYLLHTRQLY